jgi:hypothetical protein
MIAELGYSKMTPRGNGEYDWYTIDLNYDGDIHRLCSYKNPIGATDYRYLCYKYGGIALLTAIFLLVFRLIQLAVRLGFPCADIDDDETETPG